MPGREAILEGLTAIARGGWGVSVAWHVILGAALLGLARGVRPTQRAAALLLTAPLASVSVLAAAYANPFNASVFGGGAAALAALAIRLPHERVHGAATAWTAVAACLVVLGWAYPHFLEDRSPLLYLIAAPFGVVPCPTLSVVVGLALLGRGFGSRVWSTTLASLALFYGLFGALGLGVAIDWVLAAGASLLLAAAWTTSAPPATVTGSSRAQASEGPPS